MGKMDYEKSMKMKSFFNSINMTNSKLYEYYYEMLEMVL